MLNRSASLAMSTSILKALPGNLDIKRPPLVFSIFILNSRVNEICMVIIVGILKFMTRANDIPCCSEQVNYLICLYF